VFQSTWPQRWLAPPDLQLRGVAMRRGRRKGTLLKQLA